MLVVFAHLKSVNSYGEIEMHEDYNVVEHTVHLGEYEFGYTTAKYGYGLVWRYPSDSGRTNIHCHLFTKKGYEHLFNGENDE